MRNAFSMIELVFTIVLIGIIASASIAKLSITRDDAEVVTGLKRIKVFISDVHGYYSAHGIFANAEVMSGISLLNPDGTKFTGDLSKKVAYFGSVSKVRKCVLVSIDESDATLNITAASDGSDYCAAMNNQLGYMIGKHHIGGSIINQ